MRSILGLEGGLALWVWALAQRGGVVARAVLHLWRCGKGWRWELRCCTGQRWPGEADSPDGARLAAWAKARSVRIGIARIVEVIAPPMEVPCG
jgi:hypothetical protein